MKIMIWAALMGLVMFAQFGVAQDNKPLDNHPRLQRIIDTAKPDLFEVTFYLTGGRKVVVERVGLTEQSLGRRFTMNSINKTIRVRPKGETERITIVTSDIEKIEFVKVKEKDDKEPVKNPS